MDPRLRRYLLRQITFVTFSVALMFLLAGRLDWLGGWLVTAIQVGSLAAQWLIVGRRHPDLLLERSGLGAGVEHGDIPLALGMAYGPFVAMLIAGLEVRLQGLPGAILIVAIAGVAVAVAGIAVTVSAMLANRFFGPVVRIQSDPRPRGRQRRTLRGRAASRLCRRHPLLRRPAGGTRLLVVGAHHGSTDRHHRRADRT